jgi:hypothetical protein
VSVTIAQDHRAADAEGRSATAAATGGTGRRGDVEEDEQQRRPSCQDQEAPEKDPPAAGEEPGWGWEGFGVELG